MKFFHLEQNISVLAAIPQLEKFKKNKETISIKNK